MSEINPAPVKEYYIAYFDILGYKEFFKEHPEQTESFLNEIHHAINNAKENLISSNKLNIFKSIKNFLNFRLETKVKIFSDNFLVCLDVEENELIIEKFKILFLLENISEIQRYFIIRHKLFLRGGITKGKISFNNDYVFGPGLIEAVELEEHAVYPRIVLSQKILDILFNKLSYTQEEQATAATIENKIKNNENITPDEQIIYNRLMQLKNAESLCYNIALNLIYTRYDNRYISYLYKLNPIDYIDYNVLENMLNFVKSSFPKDYESLEKHTFNPNNSINNILYSHKVIIEEQLQKYGNYNDVKSEEEALLRERILKKYLWVMSYHNDMCIVYNKGEFHISTIANCDRRFLRLTITVVNDTKEAMNSAQH